MKILVVLSRFPYPLEKGDKLRAYHQIKHLSLNHEVILCCVTDKLPSEAERAEIEKITSEIHVYKLNKLYQLLRLGYSLFSSKPFQTHYFFQRKIAANIQAIIEKTKPSHIYCQLIRASEYVKNFHSVPKTIDYMDALNKNYSRRISEAKGIRKWFIKEEAKRLVRYENLVFDYFENHTIISEQDQQLIYHQKRENIEVIPNGVDFDYFSPNPNDTKTIDILFTGNMGYLPNENAALYLIKEVMPVIWELNPEINVTIAGANPSLELLKLKSSKVNITGWVNDIRDIFNDSKVFVACMRQGTGLQNKLLEAMSMKLPCITTKLANNALGATPNEELYIYDNKEHLASLIIHLLNSESAQKEMAEKGNQFIHKNFSWQSANKKLEQLIINS